MPEMTQKVKVCLLPEERDELEAICRKQSVGAAKVRRARILLMSDENHQEGRCSDCEIAELVGLCERQIVRIRQKFVREGAVVLIRKSRPFVPGKLDGRAEAMLVTICCSKPPDGRDCWTLQLLCDELGERRIIESVCRETVRKALKKTNLNLGEKNGSVSRRKTAPALSHGWKKSSMSTKGTMALNIR
jgi:transposase